MHFCLIFTTISTVVCYDSAEPFQPARLVYSSAILKSFNNKNNGSKIHISIPKEIRKRQRGKRGGVRTRTRRRPYKPFLPTVVTGNARSLNNKIDELAANCRYLNEYREASLICFSETWFNDQTLDTSVDIPGFSVFRSDRTIESLKERGEGSVYM